MNTETITLREIAELFAVTEKCVRDWIKAGMPVVHKGRPSSRRATTIDLRMAVLWYFSERRTDLDLTAERAALAKVQREKIEMENAIRRGEIGLVSDMEEWFGGHVERAQKRLIQIPDELGQFCDQRAAPTVVSEARRLIYEALAELAGDDGGIKGAG